MKFRFSMLILTCVMSAACSTNSYSIKTDTIVVSRAVNVPSPAKVEPRIAPYVGYFVDALKEHGFSPEVTSDPDALRLSLEFDGGAAIGVKASLFQKDVLILEANAKNYGVGTVIARSNAINDRVFQTLASFRAELEKLQPRIKFKD